LLFLSVDYTFKPPFVTCFTLCVKLSREKLVFTKSGFDSSPLSRTIDFAMFFTSSPVLFLGSVCPEEISVYEVPKKPSHYVR
jgi:hypothetical protein